MSAASEALESVPVITLTKLLRLQYQKYASHGNTDWLDAGPLFHGSSRQSRREAYRAAGREVNRQLSAEIDGIRRKPPVASEN
jgi:hypothetical protein